MLRVKPLVVLGLFGLLSGCTIVGTVADQIAFDGNIDFFQEAGKRIDKKILSTEEQSFAQERALQRACKEQQMAYRECLKKKKQYLEKQIEVGSALTK